MSDIISSIISVNSAHDLAQSALPDAPVVVDAERPQRVRSLRRWSAGRLRVVARGTYHLANRVDPVRL